MSTDLLNQFHFPDVAREDFISKGLVAKSLAPSVTEFQQSGYDRGISYRFFLHPVKNEVKSEAHDMEVNDEIEMIEWFVNRKFKPTERVKYLPQKLLKFDKDGNAKSGLYYEAYKRFKEGLGAQGLPLTRWEKISAGEVKTLESEGIFTVQQFAALPKDRVEGRFPKNLVKAFNDAIHFVNGLEKKEDVKQYADELLVMKQTISKLTDQNEALREKIESIEEGRGKSKGKKKKEDDGGYKILPTS